MDKKKTLKMVIVYLIMTVIAFVTYYVTLPAINLCDTSFWIYLAFVIFLFVAPVGVKIVFTKEINNSKKSKNTFDFGGYGFNVKGKKLLYIAVVPIAVILIGSAVSSPFFCARAYAGVITVKESVFSEDIPDVQGDVKNIALMDTESATILGKRTLGDLSDVVSQYEISSEYNQINLKRTPQKVANLEYADFFKWVGNRSKGVPGYVMVDPVHNTAKYVKLDKPMKYVQSGFFGDDLTRKLRFSYPTKILGTPKFELTDNGEPVYIVPCLRPKVMLFGAMDVFEVIIFNPCTGESDLYQIGEVPAWVDIVYDGYLASEKYNWQGTLSGGWFNSKIGNRGCKQTTDDFGYVILEDDVWYYTGVTSVTGDESNIAFILSNARTGEYKYYPVIGAEEHSAMGAAEGEVQEKGYKASFPVLINVSGQPTYIMVLKDANGLVKLYALVNVEQYGLVATGNDQQTAMDAYRNLLVEKGVISGEVVDGKQKATFTVENVKELVINGNSVYYFESTLNGEKVYFKLTVTNDNSALLAFTKVGDELTVTYAETSTANLFEIILVE